MNKYRNTLPRLDSLIVFEAVVRCGGISNAARELNVSQAAVSKRIRDLEFHFGRPLLRRVGRRVTPTGNGQSLADRTAIALDYLVEACAEARGEAALDTVSVAADTAVSHYWLGPALRAFGTSHPHISVRVVTSDLSSDQTSDNNHIAILYGNGSLPGWTLKSLFGQTLRPVASPAYIEQLALNENDNASIPARATILDHSRKGPDWTDWKIWARETGLQDLPFEAIHRFDSYALSIDAAIDGRGIALASLPLLQDLLDKDKLRTLTDLRLETRYGYYLACQSGRTLSKNARILFDWLAQYRPD